MNYNLNNDYLIVKRSAVHGEGLFAKLNIKSGQKVSLIHGELINSDECIRREDKGNVYIFYKNDDEYIDASSHSQLRYLNHSCNYNCDIDDDETGNLILYAISNINAGDELTIDYGYEEIYQYCSCSVCENKSGDRE